MSVHQNRGVSLLEAIIALGVIAAVAFVAISFSKVAEDRSKTAANVEFVRQFIRLVTEVYGVNNAYPAGTVMPEYLATKPTLPRAPYNTATGCFAIDGITDLCIAVPDDGLATATTTGFGTFWSMTLVTKAGGAAASSCTQIATAARTYMIGVEVGADEPKDGTGEWLNGQPWQDWWHARCDEPMTAVFQMR